MNSEDEEVDGTDETEEVEDQDEVSAQAATITFDDQEFADIFTPTAPVAAPTVCSGLMGQAGTGKSTELRRRIEEDPSYAILSASTGISAVNLNATTINSLLGFFDYDSLRDAYLRKSAQRKLRELVSDGYRNVILDEISMVPSYTLDTIVQIFDDVNENLKEGQQPIGLIICGDYGQLSPIGERGPKGKNKPVPWSFDAQCFHRFEPNIEKLTKVWRQSDERFLSALSFARRGEGHACVSALAAAGLEFQTFTDMEFDGTTILSENKHVDSFNMEAMKRVVGRDMYLPARRWGKERGEWKNIPVQTHIRDNSYVMILANAQGPTRGTFEYVNGDCGHVRGLTQRAGAMPAINIELVRTGKIVQVPPIVRAVDHREKPEDFGAASGLDKVDESYHPKPHYANQKKRYVSGQVQYYPLRLSYATTVHKSQGISLDRCQVDIRSWMFKQPAMCYIAMSRCRSLEGLRLVGQKEVVADACVADPRVERWL